MGAINVLSKQVAELIAAGEVIERPASVIKELVENSIDAHAKAITVEIKNGGITFMRVTDDGNGIQRDDVKNAFLRHATSKILNQEDLDNISTLGFRGEALASICAVSKVELMTKNINETDGILYRLDGGEEVSFDVVGCPQGTTFIVRDLFYNVPARMKFLKKDVSESNSIANLLDRIALSHPEISFTFIRDEKRIFKTSGDNNLKNTIFQIFGKEFTSSLIPVSYEYSGIKLNGYISKPVSARANRTLQMFFINGRYVRTKTAMAALEQAYKGSIMTGKFPSCVISMEMNCSTLDVNVHPAKLEVRFTNERPVYDCVYHAVKSALLEYDTRNQAIQPRDFVPTNPKVLAPVADKGTQLGFTYGKQKTEIPDNEPEIYVPESTNYRNTVMSEPVTIKSYDPSTVRKINLAEYRKEQNEKNISQSNCENIIPINDKINTSQPTNNIKDFSDTENKDEHDTTETNPPQEPQTVNIVDENQRDIPIKYIGEAFSTYIILEYGENDLMFIDKHAAHERLIYEKLKKQNVDSHPQMLLEPVAVTLDKNECETVLENKDLLLQAGFDVDYFGNSTVLIRAVPIMLENSDIAENFTEITDYLQKHKKIVLSEKMEWIYQNTACRAAVKAGNISHPQELIDLVLTLEKNPEVRYCPHGRPIYFLMSKSELEKSFKRHS
ncbi:MAG: DNA mismatch repair endonuclease MutL [Clostridia bacterium]|nr:DNA mismatch repair endonuclease MutL [Clostridia bacterium]